MEFVAAFFTVVFVAIIIGTALTFSFALFVVFVVIAVLISAWVLLRQYWIRWRFIKSDQRNQQSSKIIDAEYREITDNKD